ncbi:MAG: substrate-binding domain-containing protein, partial [Kiritimatiellae bacterium]|nr:substrate-binding domain-containing protein [Kiritimatiellia bacterium]
MPETTPIPKIAIFISTALKGARSTLRGIFDYAAAHGPWFCMFMEGRPGEQLLDLAKDGGADGVIVTGLTRPGVRDIAAFHAPVVFVEPSPDMIAPDFPMQDVPWVGRDSHAIGEMAARYYLERGYTSFAFVGEPGGLYWSAERRRGFAETVAAAGFGCKVRDSFTEEEKRSWAVERKSLVRFLRGLPKPTAVFAPMDGRARLVLEACLVGGIKVPEE